MSFMFYVYILKSLNDGRIYVGYTKCLTVRLKKHNAGSVISTKHRRPLTLLYKEQFLPKADQPLIKF